jgi:hypothetical protein
VIDRSKPQIGFEGPEDLLDLGEGHKLTRSPSPVGQCAWVR